MSIEEYAGQYGGFNGAALLRARRRRHAMTEPRKTPRFNGAALLRARRRM